MVEPNAELECYIGLHLNEVQNDLVDKDIEYRILDKGSRYTMDAKPNRVNLKFDPITNLVTQAYYG